MVQGMMASREGRPVSRGYRGLVAQGSEGSKSL